MTDEDEQPPPEAAPEQEPAPEAPETAPFSLPDEPTPEPTPEPEPPTSIEPPALYRPIQYDGDRALDVEGRHWEPGYIQFLTDAEAEPFLRLPDTPFRRHPSVLPRLGSPTGPAAPTGR